VDFLTAEMWLPKIEPRKCWLVALNALGIAVACACPGWILVGDTGVGIHYLE
jgi:hypothetical protein